MKIVIFLFTFSFALSTQLMAQTIMNIHQSNGTVLQIPVNTIDSITYTINNPGNLASITTTAISSNTGTSAVSGGNITNNGGSLVTSRGVCWSTSPNPTTANNITTNGSGTGSFTSTLTGLTANTTYYVRAYAINSAGTAYGNELSFTSTGSSAGSITALNCASATNNGTLTAGTAASGVSSAVPYTGGNGGTYSGQTVNSTGVIGLTATLAAGTFANGSGSLNYTISGTPTSGGTASFALNVGGRNCTLSLTVEIVSNPGPGVNYNGYTYPTVVLGNGQEWMAHNLRTTQYNDGTSIPIVTAPNQWAANNNNSTTLPMMCWYDNDQAAYTANNFGALYNWYAVNPLTNGNKNVCPAGWHVPTDAEWSTFINYLDPNAAGGNNPNTAGGKMKSTGTQYWLSPNTGATNESGFSGLPGGYRVSNGPFTNVGYDGYWWSSTEDFTAIAWNRGLNYSAGYAGRGNYDKTLGFSVRCLRD
jgi:uncharacterized protein (TIGR02145 family)